MRSDTARWSWLRGCSLQALAWLAAVLALCSLLEGFCCLGKCPTCSICAACRWVPESTELALLRGPWAAAERAGPALLAAQPEGCQLFSSTHCPALRGGVAPLGHRPGTLGARGTLPSPRVAISSSFRSSSFSWQPLSPL